MSVSSCDFIGNPDLDEPALAHRVAVHQRRIADDRRIDLDDLAGNRRVNLRRDLNRFDDRRRRALLEGRAGRRKLDKDHIPELLLRVLRDADGCDIAIDCEATRDLW